jgi:hypothetical protein
MGKLVLAIAAVLLLQVAFFAYLAVSDQRYASGPVVRSRNFPKIQEPPLLAQQPQASQPETDTQSSTQSSAERPEAVNRKRASSPLLARRTRRSSMEQPPSGLQVRAEMPKPIVIYVKSSPPYEERNVARVRGERVTPRDFKMSLPESSSAVASTQAKAVNPRKRSFLARTFMPLVTKPWRFMKSVASKLH